MQQTTLKTSRHMYGNNLNINVLLENKVENIVEKWVIMTIISFCHNVFEIRPLQRRQKASAMGKD